MDGLDGMDGLRVGGVKYRAVYAPSHIINPNLKLIRKLKNKRCLEELQLGGCLLKVLLNEHKTFRVSKCVISQNILQLMGLPMWSRISSHPSCTKLSISTVKGNWRADLWKCLPQPAF